MPIASHAAPKAKAAPPKAKKRRAAIKRKPEPAALAPPELPRLRANEGGPGALRVVPDAPRAPIQEKLRVSEPGHALEEEADRVADRVLRMPAAAANAAPAEGSDDDEMQREADDGTDERPDAANARIDRERAGDDEEDDGMQRAPLDSLALVPGRAPSATRRRKPARCSAPRSTAPGARAVPRLR